MMMVLDEGRYDLCFIIFIWHGNFGTYCMEVMQDLSTEDCDGMIKTY